MFKGGGAKGICYAGALEECERWEIEFAEVAGASAGAITATLVACGYTAEDMIEMMPEALDAIGSVPIALAMVGRPGLLGNEKLYEFLRDAIWRRLHPDSENAPHDCTFGEIERITRRAMRHAPPRRARLLIVGDSSSATAGRVRRCSVPQAD